MGNECEGGLVTRDALVSKVLEDLFKCRLRHAVLFDSKTTLFMLQLAEEPADSLVVLGHAKFEKFAALLEDLNLLEVAHQEMKNSETVGLRAEEHDEVSQTHLTIPIKTGLEREIRTEATISDLIQNHDVELYSHELLDRALQVNLRLDILLEA